MIEVGCADFSTGLTAFFCGVLCLALYRFVNRSLSNVVIALLIVLISFLSLTLAKPYVVQNKTDNQVIVVVDISDSMDEAIAEASFDHLKEFEQAGYNILLLPFAKKVAPSLIDYSGQSYRALKSKYEELDIGGSDLETALRRATSLSGGSVVLISDANETQGDAGRFVASMSSHVFPLTPNKSEELNNTFKLTNLSVPLMAAQKKSVLIRASLKNSTSRLERGRLELKHDNKVILNKDVEILPGQELIIEGESDPALDGIREVTATLTPLNSGYAPSVMHAFLSSKEREKVLLLNGSSADAKVLEEVLKEQAYQLTSVLAGSKELDAINNLDTYSVVIFNNIAHSDLPVKLPESVQSFVKAGGGFVMIGGDKSFGLGGYINTPIERILPVELVPPQTTKKRLNVGVALVMDKSGSMSAGGKIDFAKEAAKEVIRNLKDDDYITVIGFDDAPFVVLRVSRVGEIRYQAEDRIGRLYPAGRTNLLPAMDEGRRALLKIEAGRKHMIVLTDGRLPDEGPIYPEITKQMRLVGITLSTVMVGGEVDYGFLRSLADAGGGGFYQTSDARSLPRIFLQDLKASTGERTLKESEQFLVRPGSGEIQSTGIRSFPPLRGYVETKPRDKANLELVAFSDDKAEPLLASWKVESGKVVAFTSDSNGRWTNQWVDWPKYFTFWNDIVNSTRRSTNDNELSYDLRYSVERGSLKFDMALFGDKDPGLIKAKLKLPNGEIREVDFNQILRGRYQAIVTQITAGKYELRPIAGTTASALTPVAFFLSGELFGERKGLGYNYPLLYKLADQTGGKINPGIAVISAAPHVETKRVALGPVILFLSMITLVILVLVREVGVRNLLARVV